MDAYDGYALANGITKKNNKLSVEDVAEIRARIAEEKRKDRLRNGNA